MNQVKVLPPTNCNLIFIAKHITRNVDGGFSTVWTIQGEFISQGNREICYYDIFKDPAQLKTVVDRFIAIGFKHFVVKDSPYVFDERMRAYALPEVITLLHGTIR